MRRLAFLLLALAAVAAPAAALAATSAVGDGTLVVQDGQAPDSGPDRAPVVRLTITGSVIGQVEGQGKIIIDGGVKSQPPEVSGPGVTSQPYAISDTATVWTGGPDGFKFRAVGPGRYTIVIFGSDVSLVAVGTGSVQLAGMPDLGKGDGRYSLNGDPTWKSLPGSPTNKLSIGSNG
jgi:uncharacterized protein (DUF2141 family)